MVLSIWFSCSIAVLLHTLHLSMIQNQTRVVMSLGNALHVHVCSKSWLNEFSDSELSILSVRSQLPPSTLLYWLTPLANLPKFAPMPAPKCCPGTLWEDPQLDDHEWVPFWTLLLTIWMLAHNAQCWRSQQNRYSEQHRSKRVQVIPVPGDLDWRYHKTIISTRRVFPVPYIYCCCMRHDIVHCTIMQSRIRILSA